MVRTEELLNLWRIWMRKTRTISKEDLDEMEDHLIEEIEYLMKEENLDEEEAFHKATSHLGKRKEITETLYKLKKEKTRKRWLIATNTALLFTLLAFIVIFFHTFSFESNRISRHLPFNYPCDGKIEPGFGNRIHPIFGTPDFHTGIDIVTPEGTELKATADGIVEEAGWAGGYGYRVIIDHGNNIKSLYAHCSELLVKKGDKIQRSQVIARAGATGTAVEPHVHYEIIQDGKQIDPEAFNKNLLDSVSK
jgi:murein DD-endopeptidase MepM/ murein hydrolase activator NlpD